MTWCPPKQLQNTAQCPPKQLEGITDPTKQNVLDVYQPYVLNHFHPEHTQVNVHQIYQHQHHYPHTVSYCCDVQHQHVNCGCPTAISPDQFCR
ncbi:spore coat protein D [Scopulibacillus darangshiensis]|uniref:Spore coat protein D n=1 Tax=Scopulibacillus darangshiensis TaxID=442528 RepID=A0A4R2NSE4_9BACL|nr:CotD family spore coat protein [Scopulibacillus darangshiensis]TCP24863.1 spore coat protein D [Scopulibacillus darangshiensis]